MSLQHFCHSDHLLLSWFFSSPKHKYAFLMRRCTLISLAQLLSLLGLSWCQLWSPVKCMIHEMLLSKSLLGFLNYPDKLSSPSWAALNWAWCDQSLQFFCAACCCVSCEEPHSGSETLPPAGLPAQWDTKALYCIGMATSFSFPFLWQKLRMKYKANSVQW